MMKRLHFKHQAHWTESQEKIHSLNTGKKLREQFTDVLFRPEAENSKRQIFNTTGFEKRIMGKINVVASLMYSAR